MAGALARRNVLKLALAAFALLALAVPVSQAADNFIFVQSTTSTQNSGLFEHILPLFTKRTGIEVRVVAVGTGQALKNAENGDGDVVLVHSEPDEEKFAAEGWGVKRYPVMYNDFIIVGPAADPAKIAGLKPAPEALKKIAQAQAPFASRADDSGTIRLSSSYGSRRVSIRKHTAAVGIWRPAPAWARL
jgi:tungstate transport system substrate-binding protein